MAGSKADDGGAEDGNAKATTGSETSTDSGSGPESMLWAFAGQLREAADVLMSGWAEAGKSVGLPAALPLPPPPAASTARQLHAVLSDIGAKRAQVQAMATQLQSFDQQLALLEETLEPLRKWANALSDVERVVTDPFGAGRKES